MSSHFSKLSPPGWVPCGTRDGAKAGRPVSFLMPSIVIKRLASGAVLCFVIKSLGLSFPGSLYSLSSRDRSFCRTQVGGGEVSYSP